MSIKIPSQSNPILFQNNQSSILGTITDSFNLDLTSDLGKIKTTKTLVSKRSTSVTGSDFGGSQNEGVGAIATLQGNIWLISGSNIWIGGNSPSDAFTIDTSTNTPVVQYQDSDLKGFNSTLFVVNQNDIKKYNSGTLAWDSIYTFSTSGQAHLFTTHQDRLYFSFDEYKIGSIDITNTATDTGTYTFNPNLPGFSISFMKSDGNKLWIGYMNTLGGNSETTYVIQWDGSTENIPSAVFKIESRGILAGCIVDNVPYVVDSNGRLLAYNGSSFQEIASFPLKPYQYLYGVGSKFNQRAIHPNGMTYDATTKDILINVSNVQYFSAPPTFFNFPGGVWAYKKETGLIHKYSPSIQPVADSGTTNLADWGQYNVIYGGAISCLGLRGSIGDKGRIVFGATVALGSTIDLNTTSCTAGLFTDDTLITAQNFSSFITTEIHSSSITETWQTVHALYSNLRSTTDKIVLNFKTESDSFTDANITWSDIDRITTTTNVSAYTVGNEVQFIQGYGSGKFIPIKSISESGGTYTIIFDENVPDIILGMTGVARFNNSTYIGKVTSTDTQQVKEFPITFKNISPFIKIKVGIQSTGDNEMYGLFLQNNSEIK